VHPVEVAGGGLEAVLQDKWREKEVAAFFYGEVLFVGSNIEGAHGNDNEFVVVKGTAQVGPFRGRGFKFAGPVENQWFCNVENEFVHGSSFRADTPHQGNTNCFSGWHRIVTSILYIGQREKATVIKPVIFWIVTKH
jgi:hypothetical protein